MASTTEVAQPGLADDPLFPLAQQLALGRSLGVSVGDDTRLSPVPSRPFALRFAVVPANPLTVDLTELRYDPVGQVSVDATGAPAYSKHSTGKTSTKTSDGHKSMDSDEDHTED